MCSLNQKCPLSLTQFFDDVKLIRPNQIFTSAGSGDEISDNLDSIISKLAHITTHKRHMVECIESLSLLTSNMSKVDSEDKLTFDLSLWLPTDGIL